MYMFVCVVTLFMLDVRLVDAPAEVTQEEGRTGFLPLPSLVLVVVVVFFTLTDRALLLLLLLSSHMLFA